MPLSLDHLSILLSPSQRGQHPLVIQCWVKRCVGMVYLDHCLVIPRFSMQTGVLLLSCGWGTWSLQDTLPKARKQVVWDWNSGLPEVPLSSLVSFASAMSLTVLPVISGSCWPWSPYSCTVRCCPMLFSSTCTELWHNGCRGFAALCTTHSDCTVCFVSLWCYPASTA